MSFICELFFLFLKKNSMLTVDIKVSPILKEFIEAKWGGDTIVLGKDDYFTQKIKHILQRYPENYVPIKPSDRDSYVRMEVKRVELVRIGSRSLFEKVAQSAYLDSYLQEQIAKELDKYFKEIFHAYVLAFCSARSFADNCQRDGILDFCDVYNLRLNKVNFEMLKKSWYRSNEYQLFKKMREKLVRMVSSTF